MKRHCYEKYTRRRQLMPAEDVLRVRLANKMNQSQFAAALHVARRTVIRAEQRGLEIPWNSDSTRNHVWQAWKALADNVRK